LENHFKKKKTIQKVGLKPVFQKKGARKYAKGAMAIVPKI
jgi:hypothetical protein